MALISRFSWSPIAGAEWGRNRPGYKRIAAFGRAKVRKACSLLLRKGQHDLLRNSFALLSPAGSPFRHRLPLGLLSFHRQKEKQTAGHGRNK